MMNKDGKETFDNVRKQATEQLFDADPGMRHHLDRKDEEASAGDSRGHYHEELFLQQIHEGSRQSEMAEAQVEDADPDAGHSSISSMPFGGEPDRQGADGNEEGERGRSGDLLSEASSGTGSGMVAGVIGGSLAEVVKQTHSQQHPQMPDLPHAVSFHLKPVAVPGQAQGWEKAEYTGDANDRSPLVDAVPERGMVQPEDFAPGDATVEENAASGTVVAVLETSGALAGESISFVLEEDPSGLFVIDGNQLLVREGADIDFESASHHTLVISAQDEFGNRVTANIEIEVQDVNERPTMVGDAAISVLEGAAPAAGTVDAFDPDAGDHLTFGVAEGAEVPAGFELHGDGSWSFDPSDGAYDHLGAGDSQVLTVPVVVSDDQGATDRMQIRLMVNGTNDAPVAGAGVDGVVDEGSAVLSGRLDAGDVDDGASLSFGVAEGAEVPAGFALHDDGSWSFDPSDGAYDHLGAGDSQVLTVPVVVSDDQGATDRMQ
ncbi:MAG TPA: hypothetical protein ENI96_10790, partial [Sedimenticola thiotaurini]|nr:hypothetical protein [Sedimenticola thiotaurini]